MSHYLTLVINASDDKSPSKLIDIMSRFGQEPYEDVVGFLTEDDYYFDEIRELYEVETIEECLPFLDYFDCAEAKLTGETTPDGRRIISFKYAFNPDALWDWWVEGGRWSDWLIDKSGKHTLETTLDNIDLELMKNAKIEQSYELFEKHIVPSMERYKAFEKDYEHKFAMRRIGKLVDAWSGQDPLLEQLGANAEYAVTPFYILFFDGAETLWFEIDCDYHDMAEQLGLDVVTPSDILPELVEKFGNALVSVVDIHN